MRGSEELGALSRFERMVEGMMEMPFNRLLRPRLQPIEIAKRLARAMEEEQTIGVGKTFAPNEYTVFLHPDDLSVFAPYRLSLESELAEYVRNVAGERRLALISRPMVKLESDATSSPRRIRIVARLVDPPTATSPAPVQYTQKLVAQEVRQAVSDSSRWHAVLTVKSGPLDGTRFPLCKEVLRIGRGLDNDILLEDARVSRYHAEIRFSGKEFSLRDMESTNGTWVNGHPVAECVLEDGDRISLGGLELVFQVNR